MDNSQNTGKKLHLHAVRVQAGSGALQPRLGVCGSNGGGEEDGGQGQEDDLGVHVSAQISQVEDGMRAVTLPTYSIYTAPPLRDTCMLHIRDVTPWEFTPLREFARICDIMPA